MLRRNTNEVNFESHSIQLTNFNNDNSNGTPAVSQEEGVLIGSMLSGYTTSRLDKFIDDQRKAFEEWKTNTYTPNKIAQDAQIAKIESHFIIDDKTRTITIPSNYKFIVAGNFQQGSSEQSLLLFESLDNWRWANNNENTEATRLINKWNNELRWENDGDKIQFGGSITSKQLETLQLFLGHYGSLAQLYNGFEARPQFNKIYLK